MTIIPASIIAAAQASQAKYGIPASISIAQWAVESLWGRRMPKGSNNPFGIKARKGEASVVANTREVLGGRDVYINDGFRKFASIEEAFDEHGKFLATRSPYARARTKLPDPDAFADALTGVYATDPRYGAVLKSIMRSNNLYQYDHVAPQITPAHPAHRDVLREGDSGPDVVLLQQKLATHDNSINLLVDGKFGPATKAAVKAYQRSHGLVEDGIAGRLTQDSLGHSGWWQG